MPYTKLASSFLGDNPQISFLGAIPGSMTGSQRQFMSNRYGNVYNQYQGALGQEARDTGNLPELTFEDFLKKYPWLQDYYGTTTRERGQDLGSLTPMSRYLFY